MDLADSTAGGRIVSVLEGGYDLAGLERIGCGPCFCADGGIALKGAQVAKRTRHNTPSNISLTPSFQMRTRKPNGREHHADVKKLTFETAIEELESIVKRLEDGKVPLEESVAIYERGEALKRRCDELLRQAEARVDKITTDSNGKAVGTEPLDVQ